MTILRPDGPAAFIYSVYPGEGAADLLLKQKRGCVHADLESSWD